MPANDPSIWWIFMKQAPFAWLQCQHWGSAISYEYLWGCLQMHNCQGNLTGPSSHMDRDQHLWNARLGFVSEDQFKGNRGRVAVYVAINNWNGVLRYSWRPFSIIYWSITSYNEKGNCYQKKSRTLTPAPTLAGRDMRVKCGRKSNLLPGCIHSLFTPFMTETKFFPVLDFLLWKSGSQNAHDRPINLDNRAQTWQSATPSKGTFWRSSTDNERPRAVPGVNFWW